MIDLVRLNERATLSRLIHKYMFNFFKPRYYISLCCIVKDENDYLEEWISYHRKIGVEKFYIYDNESKIPVALTLAKLIGEEVVVVTEITGSAVQCEAYKLCLKKHGRKSRWMGFIDLDEFIVPKSTSGNLKRFLQDYEEYGAVGINWLMFGSSGLTRRGKEPQFERFIYRSKESLPENTHIKSIVQPRHTVEVITPHSFAFRNTKYCVNEIQEIINGPFSPNSTSLIQLNHYYCRSLEEFNQKMIRGRADTTDANEQRTLKNFKDFNEVANEIRDDAILRLLTKV